MFLAEVDDLRALLFWLVFILLPLLGRLMGWIAKKVAATGVQEQEPRRSAPRVPESTSSTSGPTYASSTEEVEREKSVYASLEEDDDKPGLLQAAAARLLAERAGPASLRVPLEEFEADVAPPPAAVNPHARRKSVASALGEGAGQSSLAKTSFGTAERFAAFDQDMAARSLGGDIEVLGAPSNVAPRRPERTTRAASPVARPSLTFDRESLRNAIVWAEILALPVSLRDEEP